MRRRQTMTCCSGIILLLAIVAVPPWVLVISDVLPTGDAEHALTPIGTRDLGHSPIWSPPGVETIRDFQSNGTVELNVLRLSLEVLGALGIVGAVVALQRPKRW